MPVDHSEANLEATIEALLADVHGYRRRQWDKDYDRARCLDTELLLQFIITTQPKTWEELKKQRRGREGQGEDRRKRLEEARKRRGSVR